jgi:hypothetical protein
MPIGRIVVALVVSIVSTVGTAGNACAQEAQPDATTQTTEGSKNSSRASGTSRTPYRLGFDQANAVPVVHATDIAASQGPGNSSTTTSEGQTATKRGQIVGVPIPISSPFLGSGLGLLGAYVFCFNQKDTVSPSSVIGGGGFYTSSSSWALLGFSRLYLKQDHYRLTFAIGKGEVNYNLYGIGNAAGASGQSVPLQQSGRAVFVEGLRRLKWNFLLGPRYQVRSVEANLANPNDTPPPGITLPPRNHTQQTAALGIRLQNDSRNSVFYPTGGGLFDFVVDAFRPGVGSDRNYEHFQFAYNGYPSISATQVLAYRIYGCAVADNGNALSDRVPFYDYCLLGMDNDIRGYSTGRYRDRLMLTAQAEYRRQLSKRFGVVAFFGIGEVAPDFGSFNSKNILPAGGTGLRYMVDKKDHINIRVDYAVGKDGGAYYVGLNEAF